MSETGKTIVKPELSNSKIFIIGLPRTATTSLCAQLLNLGFSVAHTCYTQAALDKAQVIADTPIFTDYPMLDKHYPKAKFIYLERELSLWLPSIKQLLARMYVNVSRADGGFNPYLKRCFSEVFFPFTLENINDDAFLTQCYLKHQDAVFEYFKERQEDLLSLSLSEQSSFSQLLKFLAINHHEQNTLVFPHLNSGKKVTAWKQINHPLKVEATHLGKIDRHLSYFVK